MKLTQKSVELKETLRDLWLDHVFWERNAAFGVSLGEGAAVDVADEKVVMNAKAIADSLRPYYGNNVADQMFSLLATHYTAVKDYLMSTHTNSKSGQDAAKARLMQNAGEISTFMAQKNPYWVKETLLPLFTAHASHHMVQIENFHVRNYGAEARVYVEMKRHVYMIADAMAAGIAKQFPKKF
ncbi:hypothetical protein LPW11_21320 [Geomonas sp. RF6]|uniref:hypothetical protein n=1 Tax=Geomonas sp. RF6 TaxID=2897342 RepID=UPI001E2FC0CB|nr:hypothetical protein [Geomonas sp. RF6]UFS70396.1 hypothetical protein LPW11_21320 [Geomonas sp. RF6]